MMMMLMMEKALQPKETKGAEEGIPGGRTDGRTDGRGRLLLRL